MARKPVEAGPRLPSVAIVGRPNVGKSTLANRLAGRKQAISHESPGVTRDRVEIPVHWGGRSFVVVDTGGYVPRAQGLDAAVVHQASMAIEGAALVLLVVDGTAGVLDEDRLVARAVQRGSTPVLLVVNKVDGAGQESSSSEFFALGLGEPLTVSALHGRGSGDLLDRIVAVLPEVAAEDVPAEMRYALVGRPNVGKSSLMNRLLGEERAVVDDLPGTTRDAVDSMVEVEGRRIRFVDTAGFRRPLRTTGVEYYSLVRAIRAIDESHVAALVVDAAVGATGEDRRLAARVSDAGRGLVVVLNKWDLVPSEARAERFTELGRELALIPGAPVVRTSALTGSGVLRVLPALLRVHQSWSRRVPTADVNRILAEAVSAKPPPRVSGRIRYGTQVSAGPPSFVLFGVREPMASYRRYLENVFRRAFGLDGAPVRISFRVREPRGERAPAARPAREGKRPRG